MEIIVKEVKVGELTTFEISEVRCIEKIKEINFDYYSSQLTLPFDKKYLSKVFDLSKEFQMSFSIITDSIDKQLLLF